MNTFLNSMLAIVFSALSISTAVAQFAPAVGMQGSTAIHKDSTVFVTWASGCTLQRGYMDIAIPDSGYTTVGNGSSAVGKAGQSGVVSLGDGGVATLTFANHIFNGPGFDFAVFENGFYTNSPLAFLEFAFVEVSSDGNNFFRFPATSNIQDTTQIPMTGVDCSLVNNLAGKYVAGYGTPFDLDELKDEPGLDVNNITHVRIVDVVGSVNELYATHDQYGHKINDPYPTAFASGGFDLDAVGVIHAQGITAVEEVKSALNSLTIYPNPAVGNTYLAVNAQLIGERLTICDLTGAVLYSLVITDTRSELPTANLATGLYIVSVASSATKLIVE